jgi:hypothetical protein
VIVARTNASGLRWRARRCQSYGSISWAGAGELSPAGVTRRDHGRACGLSGRSGYGGMTRVERGHGRDHADR